MNGCSNLKRWGTECRNKFPIHHEFLNRFLYWTSDKVVLSKRPKQKSILSGKDIIKAKDCQDIINGKGVARNAFKEGAFSASSVDIEMMVIDDVPEKVIVIHNIEEETEVVTNTVVETEDVAEDVVIKAEVADDDSLGNALTEEDYEPNKQSLNHLAMNIYPHFSKATLN